jgi:threonine dehydrogenase-like Zn-dependent dehydrogenase
MSAATQRVATLVRPETVRVTTAPIPEPNPGQVRVKLEGCGICASSLSVWEGRPWFEYPRPAGSPGHEGWGRVDALGDGVRDLREGDRVVMVSSNAYADFDVAERAAVVRIPDELRGMAVPGEPLGCAMNIFERSDVRAGQNIAIVGVGFLGLLLTQLASRRGARVVAISRRQCALDLARLMGADATVRIDPGSDVAAQAARHVGSEGFARVIEAVGLQSTLDIASALVAERGRLVIAGYHQDGPRQVDMQQWNWRGLDVVNAHERAVDRYAQGMQEAMTAILAGRLDPFPLLTHTVPMDALDCGFELTRRRPEGFVKALALTGAIA